jgi:hypothetical protein
MDHEFVKICTSASQVNPHLLLKVNHSGNEEGSMLQIQGMFCDTASVCHLCSLYYERKVGVGHSLKPYQDIGLNCHLGLCTELFDSVLVNYPTVDAYEADFVNISQQLGH